MLDPSSRQTYDKWLDSGLAVSYRYVIYCTVAGVVLEMKVSIAFLKAVARFQGCRPHVHALGHAQDNRQDAHGQQQGGGTQTATTAAANAGTTADGSRTATASKFGREGIGESGKRNTSEVHAKK